MITAYILMLVRVGKPKEVVRDVSGLEGVVEATAVYGEFDVVAKVVSPDLKTLDKTILEELPKIDGITHTTTMIATT